MMMVSLRFLFLRSSKTARDRLDRICYGLHHGRDIAKKLQIPFNEQITGCPAFFQSSSSSRTGRASWPGILLKAYRQTLSPFVRPFAIHAFSTTYSPSYLYPSGGAYGESSLKPRMTRTGLRVSADFWDQRGIPQRGQAMCFEMITGNDQHTFNAAL